MKAIGLLCVSSYKGQAFALSSRVACMPPAYSNGQFIALAVSDVREEITERKTRGSEALENEIHVPADANVHWRYYRPRED